MCKLNRKYLLINLSVASILFSCAGENSNPLEKYPDLKSTSPTDVKIENQTVAQPDLFDLQIIDTNQVNLGNFVEGESSKTLLQVKMKSTKILEYKIELVDFSSVERPKLESTETKDIFALNWNPPVGIIPVGEWGKSFQAKLQITVTNAENKVLIGLTKTVDLTLVVNRNNTQPQITGRTDLKNGVKEGVASNFTIDVEDKAGMQSPRLPEIQITPYIYTNTEAYRADASHYLVLDYSKKLNPEKIGPQKFRFYYLIEIEHLPLNRDRLGNEIPTSNSVDICFLMRAVSAVGTLSDQLQVCSKASYQAQAPQLFLDENSLKELKSGVEYSIPFKISSEHPLSEVSFKSPSQQIALLSGTKQIQCSFTTSERKNEISCLLKWKPACVTVNTVKTLNFKADSSINTTVRTLNYSKEIVLTPHPEVCTPVKPNKGAN